MSQLTRHISDITPFPGRPKVLAKLTATQSNVTGDGTIYTIIFNQEIYDVGSNYDNTTGIFTAPSSQTYLFNFNVDLRELAATHTSGDLRIVSSNRIYFLDRSNYGAIRDGGNLLEKNVAVQVDMEAGDTATCAVRVSNSTLTVDLFGAGGSDFHTWLGIWFLG